MNPQKLKMAMATKDISNVRLASKVGVHAHYISDLRRGVKKPSKSLTRLLEIVLDATLEDSSQDEKAQS